MNYKFPNPKNILNVSNQSDNDNEDIKQHQLQIINRVLLNHNISCECNNIIDAANVLKKENDVEFWNNYAELSSIQCYISIRRDNCQLITVIKTIGSNWF